MALTYEGSGAKGLVEQANIDTQWFPPLEGKSAMIQSTTLPHLAKPNGVVATI